jgi:UDPglucose--hexose-1-phosphate uridylyltransferase
MAEFRYNPLLDDWTIVNGARQKRPDMPKDYCAFCPGSGKVPDDYTVFKYDNDWPSMSLNPAEPDPVANAFFKTRPSYGKCEVILYSPEHNASIWDLTPEHVQKLVRLWKDRWTELSQDEKIKYILIFENRGAEVGTTQPHPHGQLYAYGYLPLRIRLELLQCKSYYKETGESLLLRLRDEEIAFGQRVFLENEHFVCFLPFYTDWPYGCYVLPKVDHLHSFSDFDETTEIALADILRQLQGTFDVLFDRPFPYMMGIYQRPLHVTGFADADTYYTFHLKFFPPLRGAGSIKWNASSETCAWAKTNPRIVEETAAELREAHRIYLERDLES